MLEKPSLSSTPVSGSGKDNQSQTPSGEGKSPSEKEVENRIRENLRAEYERKAEIIAEERDELKSRLEALEEKEEQDKLTRAEQAEKSRLETKVEGLEEGLFQLDHDPQYAVMREKFKRTKAEAIVEATNTVKKELAHENSIIVAEMFIDQMAYRESLKDEGKDITTEKLEKELTKIAESDWDYFKRLSPYERVKKAFKVWQREGSYSKKLKELERKEKSESNFSDNSNTIPSSEKSTSQLIKDGNIDEALSRI